MAPWKLESGIATNPTSDGAGTSTTAADVSSMRNDLSGRRFIRVKGVGRNKAVGGCASLGSEGDVTRGEIVQEG